MTDKDKKTARRREPASGAPGARSASDSNHADSIAHPTDGRKSQTPSRWLVERRLNGGRRVYAVYRLLDRDGPDRSNNREYRGLETSSRLAAENLAQYLNEGAGT